MKLGERLRKTVTTAALMGSSIIVAGGGIIAINEFRTRHDTEQSESQLVEYMPVDFERLAKNPDKYYGKYVMTTGYVEREETVIYPNKELRGAVSLQALVDAKLFKDSSKTGASLNFREILVSKNDSTIVLPAKVENEQIRGKIILAPREDNKIVYYFYSINDQVGIGINP